MTFIGEIANNLYYKIFRKYNKVYKNKNGQSNIGINTYPN